MKLRIWSLLFLATVFCSLAHADVPPPRSVQVFFDDNMQSNVAWVSPFTAQEFKVLAYALPGGLSEYRFHLELSDTTAILGIDFPAGVMNTGVGDDYLLQVAEPCPTGNGLVVLATGIIIPTTYTDDVTFCLGPVSDPGPSGSGLDYRACGSSTWEDMSLLYEGCAVINPWATWPQPIQNNDPNAVVFNTISVQGEPTDLVSLPINLNKALLKSGDPSALGHIVLELTWDPAVATYGGVTSSVPSGWTTTPIAGPGSLNLTLTGTTGLNAPFWGTELAVVDFLLADLEGSSTVDIAVVELLDLTGLPVSNIAPASANMAVTCNKGDVVPNRDINALDVLLTLEFAAQLQQPDAKQFCRAEMNDNGLIDSGDATIILAQAVGLPKNSTGIAASPRIETTPNSLRIEVDTATGIDLSIRWDAGQGNLVSWTADPSLQCVARSSHGELQLAMARTVTTPAAVVFEFDGDGLETNLETAWFWDQAGALAADRSGETYQLGQSLPRVARLLAPVPNPFNPVTTIRYEMPASGWAKIGVFDTRGHRVWQTRIAEALPGANTLMWNGIDSRGRQLASGSYLIVLETDGGRSAVRVTLIK